MIDGNISMEEDTELRDLVVQTLENNGVLAKVRAELRASVFVALEEQESVMNPEPLLNKSVKQYLANSEGKLLFSLVREFLEYFGLDYTISVYDLETYFGKEYTYAGRNKLCEELGIESTEPLLGEILKNSMNSAFNNTQKSESNTSRHNKTSETSTNVGNTTFDVSVPKIIQNETILISNGNNVFDKSGSISDESSKHTSSLTITDKIKKETVVNATGMDQKDREKTENSLRELIMESGSCIQDENGIDSTGNNNIQMDKFPLSSNGTTTVINHKSQETELDTSNETTQLYKTEPLIKFDESITTEVQTNQNENIDKQNTINSLGLQIANNVQNKKLVTTGSTYGKNVYFDEIIIGGERESISAMQKADSFLRDLPATEEKPSSIFGDLPPLNGKKTNMNDLRELMNIGLETDGIDTYDEDFVSSASGSANDRSKGSEKLEKATKLLHIRKHEKTQNARSEDVSEEIEEADDLLSSTSCVSKSDVG